MFVKKKNLDVCQARSPARCSNKNVAQDLQEIVGEQYYCVFSGIVEDLQETVVVGVWRVVKLSIYKKLWLVMFVCGIVELL